MIRGGKPFRFLGCFAILWVGARIALLWPQTGSLPEAIKAFVPGIVRAFAAPRPGRPPLAALPLRPADPAQKRVATPHPQAWPKVIAADARDEMATLELVRYSAPDPQQFLDRLPAVAAWRTAPDRLDPLPNPWSASAWILIRPGAGLGAAPGGQIGGGQGGIRIAYLLSRKQRIAAFGRVVTPLAGTGREAALGLEWQPTRVPVRLVVEQRFGLDGVAGGPGAGLVGGYDGRGPAGFHLESYGQAGVIMRQRLEPYLDGAVRATRVVAQGDGVRLALGGGFWGAAQRDAQRLDIGPSMTLQVPIGRRQVRLALDWRQRVAGDARPGSGLTLTLGTDF